MKQILLKIVKSFYIYCYYRLNSYGYAFLETLAYYILNNKTSKHTANIIKTLVKIIKEEKLYKIIKDDFDALLDNILALEIIENNKYFTITETHEITHKISLSIYAENYTLNEVEKTIINMEKEIKLLKQYIRNKK